LSTMPSPPAPGNLRARCHQVSFHSAPAGQDLCVSAPPRQDFVSVCAQRLALAPAALSLRRPEARGTPSADVPFGESLSLPCGALVSPGPPRSSPKLRASPRYEARPEGWLPPPPNPRSGPGGTIG